MHVVDAVLGSYADLVLGSWSPDNQTGTAEAPEKDE